MMGWLLGIGGIVAFTLCLLGYAMSRLGQTPPGNPQELFDAGVLPGEQPVIVCLGDSITQGVLGTDWVKTLRGRLQGDAIVVNAGLGGQVTWDLRQRLEDVARCRPYAIVLLTGSNDAVGALGAPWTSFYERGRPQAPEEAWFAEQYDALVEQLVTITPRVACLTIPPLGEEPESQVASIVRRQNENVMASAARHDAARVHVLQKF